MDCQHEKCSVFLIISKYFRNQSVFREFIAAKMDKTTAGGEQSNFVVVAAAAAAAAATAL
jgi:hypothetical protein